MTQQHNHPDKRAYVDPNQFIQSTKTLIERSMSVLIDNIDYPAMLDESYSGFDMENPQITNNSGGATWIYKNMTSPISSLDDKHCFWTMRHITTDNEYPGYNSDEDFYTKITRSDITENSYFIKDAVWTHIWYGLLYHLISQFRSDLNSELGLVGMRDQDITCIMNPWMNGEVGWTFKDILSVTFPESRLDEVSAYTHSLSQYGDGERFVGDESIDYQMDFLANEAEEKYPLEGVSGYGLGEEALDWSLISALYSFYKYSNDISIKTFTDTMISKYNRRAIINLEKSEKFRDLAEKRVESTIKQIQLLVALSDPKNYRFNESQVNKIRNTINREIREMKSKFDSDNSFTL